MSKKNSPAVGPPDASSGGRADKQWAALMRELENLRPLAKRVAELEGLNSQLRATIDRLRQDRAARVSEPSPKPTQPQPVRGPLVSPPVAPPSAAKKPKGVLVLLDVANLAGTARLVLEGSLDYAAVLQQALAGRPLYKAHAFVIDKGLPGFSEFEHALVNAGFAVHKKRPRTFSDGSMKADWDVALTVVALSEAPEGADVVLGSGDGDYVPLVRALKKRGCRVEVACVTSKSDPELVRLADQHLDLDRSFLI